MLPTPLHKKRKKGKMITNGKTAASSAAILVVALLASTAGAAKPARLQPTRIHSLGDSITTAFDSNLLGENRSESWANGYYGFWQKQLGQKNVNSHAQRA